MNTPKISTQLLSQDDFIPSKRCNISRQGDAMQKRLMCFLTFLMMAAALAGSASAQDKSKRPSPPASATCKLADGKTITVNYSSPAMKGRKIFGDLVPYGKIWRAGANEATTFVATADLTADGKSIPAGSYTIFTIPNADKWTFVISKKTGEWGTAYPGESEDLARADMKASALSAPVENFTISFDSDKAACTMHLDWEKTRATLAFSEKK
jgi:hypothetical protein